MIEASPIEKTILLDIRERTGLTFGRIEGIDSRDRTIAEMTLPILAEWVDKVDDHRHRAALVSRFHTPFAGRHFNQLVSWWTKEQDSWTLSLLTQDIALLVTCNDALRIWNLVQTLPERPFHYLLLSKLAACNSVSDEVKEALVHALETQPLRAGDLSYISKIDDPRIPQWFGTQINSPDPAIKALAKRVVARGRKLPKGIEYTKVMPDRSHELFSTEEDLSKISPLLTRLARDYSLKVSAAVKTGAFLSSVEPDRWVFTSVLAADGGCPTLWFRLEDVDTVEVVLLPGHSPASIN